MVVWLSEIWCVGKMVKLEIVYAYVLVGNMVIGNVAIENSVAGKKSRHASEGLIHLVPIIFISPSLEL